MMKKWCLVLWIMAVLGCATASGPPFSEASFKASEALIYIYRVPVVTGSANPFVPGVKLDNTPVGPIKIGGYYPLVVAPGEHRLAITNLTGKVVAEHVFTLVAGEVKYFEYAQSLTNFSSSYRNTVAVNSQDHFLEVPAQFAKKRLFKNKLMKRSAQ